MLVWAKLCQDELWYPPCMELVEEHCNFSINQDYITSSCSAIVSVSIIVLVKLVKWAKPMYQNLVGSEAKQ